MIEKLVSELRHASSPRQAWRNQIRAEKLLTPLEARALLELSDTLPESMRNWLARHAQSWMFDSAAPQLYHRETLDPDIQAFRLPSLVGSQRRLIIAFAGAHNRLTVPTPTFLQAIPAATFDVAIIQDPRKTHFLNGPLGSSIALARRLKAALALERYQDLICYGDSMGGFAALRFGMMLGASRAISVGGRFPFHVTRLIGAEQELPAFDCLCRCYAGTRTALVAAYAAHCVPDATAAQRVARILPVDQVLFRGRTTHVPLIGLRPEQLRGFYGWVFGPGAARLQPDTWQASGAANARMPWHVVPHDRPPRRPAPRRPGLEPAVARNITETCAVKSERPDGRQPT